MRAVITDVIFVTRKALAPFIVLRLSGKRQMLQLMKTIPTLITIVFSTLFLTAQDAPQEPVAKPLQQATVLRTGAVKFINAQGFSEGTKQIKKDEVYDIAEARNSNLVLLDANGRQFIVPANQVVVSPRKIQVKQEPAIPNGGAHLTKNDRIRMLRFIKAEGMISSVRNSESISDSDLTSLYNKAMQANQLREIGSAVRGLQNP